jgi:hypothetical protein
MCLSRTEIPILHPSLHPLNEEHYLKKPNIFILNVYRMDEYMSHPNLRCILDNREATLSRRSHHSSISGLQQQQDGDRGDLLSDYEDGADTLNIADSLGEVVTNQVMDVDLLDLESDTEMRVVTPPRHFFLGAARNQS